MTTTASVDTYPAIHDAAGGCSDDLLTTSRAIHALAEIGFEEVESSRLLSGVIEQHGFQVERGVSGMPTAFVARRGRTGPHVAFLCEYDALRGLGHACGHNLIATSSAGAGIALAKSLEGRGVEARVTIVGTPAEEGGGGKIPLCADGLFDDCDAVLIFHPSDRTAAMQYALACTHWEWTFRGKAAHAAGNPDHGINALDAFVHAYNGIALWRQQLRDDARVHGFIIEGGTAPNIIPELTRGEFLTRARDGEYLRGMNVRFRAIFEAAASATGCELQLDEKETYLDLRSNAVLAERTSVHLADVGLREDVVVPWARTGSTDVGDVSYAAPTLHPEFAIADEGIGPHTHAFREAAITPRAEQAMLQAAEVLARVGADVILDADLRKRVRDAFAAQPQHREEWTGSGA
ncbi:MAG TPA: M20 family metallopeptidase [Candidatus Saccharimonadales bacterium]|nr:M20 family metallopeptidase [Candidatus Saccharimonadales bacterium]